MEDSEFVSIKELAKRIGIHHSNARICVQKLGYTLKRKRLAGGRNNLSDCVTKEEAEEVVDSRQRDGFGAINGALPDKGMFYIIQLIPELDMSRVKLGFTDNIGRRITTHRTTSPNAVVASSWPCRRTWERAAIDSLTRIGCTLVLNEVYQCSDIASLVARGDDFFKTLPVQDE